MTETELILSALKGPAPVKKKKKRLVELFPSEVIPDTDRVISSLSKTKKKKKPKRIENWSNTDFLKHLESSLEQEGLHLETTSLRDRDLMAKIYDDIAEHLKDDMSNKVFRSYLDWWVSDCSRFMKAQIIFPAMLRSDKFVSRFLHEFHNMNIISEVEESLEIEQPKTDINALYSLGGLPMILMSKGIVVAYTVMKEKGEDRIMARISDALRDLNKSSLIKCLDITMKTKYNKTEIVDFMSIAQPALIFHGIKNFNKVDYREFFV